MYSLKGIFPEPKKEQKKNFIRENMKQLKYIQGKAAKDGKLPLIKPQASRLNQLNAVPAESSLGPIKSSPSNKSKITLHISKTSSINARKKHNDIKIKKGDMAEFLKRKQLLKQSKAENDDEDDEEDVKSSESSGRLRDVGCQTVETNLAQKLEESAKLTMLYQKKDEREEEAKIKASGDQETRHRSPSRMVPPSSRRAGGEELADHERPKNRLNSILERKEQKDPYLPAGYQKGVLPKYLRERKEQGTKDAEGMKADDDQAQCPPGHVTLPDNERKETLRMLRNSFAELVSELNKMPVKTDTLRMRNRKMELEKQLAKLEEGIKVFSRPKVFVKIGE